MSHKDIVVVGASAGGVAPLQTLVRQFKADTPAAVFVVLHLPPSHTSYLPAVLGAHCELSVKHAVDGEKIQHGHVYIAPPDRHLVIESGHIHLSAAPRENRARPAINPLFRSAALTYGPRVIGVILSGMLDDGTAGLWEIKRQGGVAVVQEPDDAQFNQMPKSALANVPVDYKVPIKDIGALLVTLIGQPSLSLKGGVEAQMGEPTRLTCPDCHGPIERFRLGPITEYKCRVGHAYGPESMLAAHDDAEERALWSAIESLEEGADLADEILTAHRDLNGNGYRADATTKRKLAKSIRSAIEASKLG